MSQPPEVLASPEQTASHEISAYERVRLGGDEFAICGQVTLVPGGDNEQKIFILDVGFRRNSTTGGYGPYDIDGRGEKRTFSKPYVLVTAIGNEENRQLHTREFDINEVVTVGRSHEAGGEQLGLRQNDHISRRHVQIIADDRGKIDVKDLGSLNGTDVKSATELIPHIKSQFGFTYRMEDFVHQAGRGKGFISKDESEGWGHGMYEGRNIIARDTPINGGVYPVGGYTGEALVVDDKKYPKELTELYEQVSASIDKIHLKNVALRGINKVLGKNKGQLSRDSQVLSQVFDKVSKTLKYDLKATDDLAGNLQKIAMNRYIQEGVGVCRTQALLSAYLIERLINDGKLEGRVSIDRNQDVFEGVESGHAWARFTDKDGQIFIIDPAQRFVGTLTEAQAADNKWDYRRTEDLMRTLLAA